MPAPRGRGGWLAATVLLASLAGPPETRAQAPTGLAATALAHPSFSWLLRTGPGVRVWFQPGSYAFAHRDSLLARLPVALEADRALIDAPELPGPVDVLFVGSRDEMRTLTGHAVTGFAEAGSRTVLLVTNPEWRAFERHEIMHVVATASWGTPAAGTAWLQEGLAQAADGFCGGTPNAAVAVALAERHGWIPLDTMLTRFREQPDLRAYLQAAAFVEFLRHEAGAGALRGAWRDGATPETPIAGHPLATWEREWRETLRVPPVAPERLDRIERKGCG